MDTCRPYPGGALTLLGLMATFALLAPTDVHAQRFGQHDATDTNINAYYYFVEPGEATMEVRVLGAVRSPGLYLLGIENDTGRLLALSGGPLLDVRERSRSREITIQLLRPSGSSLQVVHEARLAGGLAGDAPNWPLQDGDVVSVEVVERQRFTLRDILTVANTVALIALAVERFASAR